MIGLDTNVLLRAVTNDDPVFSPTARRILAGLTPAAPGVLNTVVLVEFAWTLRKAYRYSRDEVIARIERVLRSAAYVVTDRDAVNAALVRCEQENIEFPDALIGELNLAAGCRTTLTFDRALDRSRAFQPAI